MQKLQTVNADTLLYEPLEKPSFVVDGLIPTGLTLFCGSQKIGKSWLMLKLCLCVSQGIPLWDMPTQEGDVLYLCLEDTFSYPTTSPSSLAIKESNVPLIAKEEDASSFRRTMVMRFRCPSGRAYSFSVCRYAEISL